jgi:hypothetical protein
VWKGGVNVKDSRAVITKAGTYEISGTLNDGQIIVESTDHGTVELILNDVDVTNTSGAPLYVIDADKVIVRWRMAVKIL